MRLILFILGANGNPNDRDFTSTSSPTAKVILCRSAIASLINPGLTQRRGARHTEAANVAVELVREHQSFHFCLRLWRYLPWRVRSSCRCVGAVTWYCSKCRVNTCSIQRTVVIKSSAYLDFEIAVLKSRYLASQSPLGRNSMMSGSATPTCPPKQLQQVSELFWRFQL